MNELRLFLDDDNGPHDVVLCRKAGPSQQICVLFSDVTASAADKLVARFDDVDLDDIDAVMNRQAEIAQSLPKAYSWHYAEIMRKLAQNAPARRYNGQYKRVGAS